MVTFGLTIRHVGPLWPNDHSRNALLDAELLAAVYVGQNTPVALQLEPDPLARPLYRRSCDGIKNVSL
jgi:hypothetical protein